MEPIKKTASCPVCGKNVGCSCQLTKAKDGRVCCLSCKISINKEIDDENRKKRRIINMNRRYIV